jgi:hypothetical protein
MEGHREIRALISKNTMVWISSTETETICQVHEQGDTEPARLWKIHQLQPIGHGSPSVAGFHTRALICPLELASVPVSPGKSDHSDFAHDEDFVDPRISLPPPY